MNVNSRGHNLDTRFELFFFKIKHPPGLKILVGVISQFFHPYPLRCGASVRILRTETLLCRPASNP